MTNLALVDDHTLMRKTMASAFELSNYSILFDAANGQEMIDKINQGSLPDLIVMDISMPVMNGFEATKWLTQYCPTVKVLALSVFHDEISIIRMLRNGAKGYITKDSHPDEMSRAVKEILENGYYYSDLVNEKIINVVNSNDKKSVISIFENLTENEWTYLRLACTDLVNKQIAEAMDTTESNASFFRQSLFKKFNVNTRIGLVLFALKNNLIEV